MGESSESIRQRAQAAGDIQNHRFTNGESKDIVCNVDMRVEDVRQLCMLPPEGQSLMRSAMSQLNLSARLSSHPETGAHDRGPCGQCGDPIRASGGGVAISSEDHDVNNISFENDICFINEQKLI